MGNCLVTKLKGVVDNANLLKLGEFCIDFVVNTVDNEASCIDLTSGANPCTLRVVDGTPAIATNQDLSDLVSTITIPANNAYRLYFRSDVAYKVAVDNKYTLKGIYSQAFVSAHVDLEEFKWCTELTRLNINVYKVGKEAGSLDSIAGLINLMTFSSYHGDIVGDILTFGNMLSLTDLSFRLTSGITGSVEALAAAQVVNGRTSGTLSVTGGNDVVTVEGTPMGYNDSAVITFDSGQPGGYSIVVTRG